MDMDHEITGTARKPCGLDLEEFRLARNLSYRKLATLIGSIHAGQTRSWAIGESRPDADQMEAIIEGTFGAVTIEAMHQKRLIWLKTNKKRSSTAPQPKSTAAHREPAA